VSQEGARHRARLWQRQAQDDLRAARLLSRRDEALSHGLIDPDLADAGD
jgi:hypothetical protein